MVFFEVRGALLMMCCSFDVCSCSIQLRGFGSASRPAGVAFAPTPSAVVLAPSLRLLEVSVLKAPDNHSKAESLFFVFGSSLTCQRRTSARSLIQPKATSL